MPEQNAAADAALTQPLSDVRVVDLSRVLAGPYSTMMLGDFGADVIKVENPGAGDDTRRYGPPWAGGESAYFLCINRNKRSVTLNLKSPEGKKILLDLVRRSDVLVENFKTGNMEELGLGYDTLREVNPGLIYCSVSGYGPEGPYKDRPGYDFILQAESGLMSVTGEPEGEPMKVGVAVVDATTGMFATIAILAALRYRDRTGQGQRVDLSLLESAIGWLVNVGANYLVSGELPKRYGTGHPNIVPYQVFRARDRYLAIAAGNDAQFRRLCRVLGVDHLADDPRFKTNPARVENREDLVPLLQTAFERRDADDWLKDLLAASLPAGPINTVDRVFSDPHVLARQMVIEVSHPTAGTVKMVGFPYKFSATPAKVRHAPPLLGQHTEDVLTNLLGFTSEQVAGLRERGVV